MACCVLVRCLGAFCQCLLRWWSGSSAIMVAAWCGPGCCCPVSSLRPAVHVACDVSVTANCAARHFVRVLVKRITPGAATARIFAPLRLAAVSTLQLASLPHIIVEFGLARRWMSLLSRWPGPALALVSMSGTPSLSSRCQVPPRSRLDGRDPFSLRYRLGLGSLKNSTLEFPAL